MVQSKSLLNRQFPWVLSLKLTSLVPNCRQLTHCPILTSNLWICHLTWPCELHCISQRQVNSSVFINESTHWLHKLICVIAAFLSACDEFMKNKYVITEMLNKLICIWQVAYTSAQAKQLSMFVTIFEHIMYTTLLYYLKHSKYNLLYIFLRGDTW